jgi:hypothetical protein
MALKSLIRVYRIDDELRARHLGRLMLCSLIVIVHIENDFPKGDIIFEGTDAEKLVLRLDTPRSAWHWIVGL